MTFGVIGQPKQACVIGACACDSCVDYTEDISLQGSSAFSWDVWIQSFPNI